MNASTTAEPTARHARLIKCRVNVTTAAGEKHSYAAMFKSTFDAVMDALHRFGIAKVRVEAAQQ